MIAVEGDAASIAQLGDARIWQQWGRDSSALRRLREKPAIACVRASLVRRRSHSWTGVSRPGPNSYSRTTAETAACRARA